MAEGVDAVMLLGPTASGKCVLAMQLAEKIPLEIVSVDSAQVYRGLNIGTAKPGASDLAAVPHHLIDIRDPADPYSAADFVRDATQAVHEIQSRGRLPLRGGGPMLYAKALREGLSNLPSADVQVRSRIEAEARELGWPQLHARLAVVDPLTAARLKPNDSQRIQRALEVYETAGATISQLTEGKTSGLKLPTIALLPSDRLSLHARIQQRFDAMLDAGLLDEIRVLHARGDLHPKLPSMRSVGYRQAWRFLDGQCTVQEFRQHAITATRQLAKRQMTWLRSMPNVTVIEATAKSALSALKLL